MRRHQAGCAVTPHPVLTQSRFNGDVCLSTAMSVWYSRVGCRKMALSTQNRPRLQDRGCGRRLGRLLTGACPSSHRSQPRLRRSGVPQRPLVSIRQLGVLGGAHHGREYGFGGHWERARGANTLDKAANGFNEAELTPFQAPPGFRRSGQVRHDGLGELAEHHLSARGPQPRQSHGD